MIKAIFKFQNDGELPNFENNKCLNMAFAQIKATFERDNIKYEERCEKNRENAIIRWNKENSSNAIAYDCIQTNANYADSDSESDIDSDSVSDRDSDFTLLKDQNCFNNLLELYPNRYNSYDENYCYTRYNEIMNKYNLSPLEVEIYFKQYLEETSQVLPLNRPRLDDFWNKIFEEYIIKVKSEVIK